ncbi:B-cell receptor CD22-like [Ptychodera flava]|uniref:B-cell receptor CD22-like n=1 Tax=Ptychodera flava TaxID=63121 RepID=UPI00396A51AE
MRINSNPEVNYHNWTKDGVVLSTELNYTIFDANRLHSGFYQCVAGNTLSDGTTGMSSSMAELDVQYTPDVNIESEASKIKEGETAKLTCRIESNPEATVHNWTKDGVIVSTGLNLTIGNARRLDSGLYECIAVNTFYDGTTGVAYYRTELSVQYFPNVTVDEKLVKIKEGGNATLKCEIDSNPEVTFHNWTKDGAVLSTYLTHTIGNVNRLDSGLYTCIAGNTLYDGTTGISNSTAELSVEYLAVTESHGPSGAVVEGVNKTMIRCTVTDGVPDPHTITLFHVNETVNRVDSTESPNGVTSHTFDLGVTQRWHNGSYYCETKTRFEDNSEESEISDEISVIVHYKPTITSTDETIFVREGSRATLTCTAEAYPGADITWMKVGKTLDVGTDSSTYVIQAVTEDNAGEYICKAENDIGTDQLIVRVSITTPVEKAALKEPLNYTLVILAAVPVIILSIIIITFLVVKALRSGKLHVKQVPYENHFYIHPDAGNTHFVGTVEMRY